MKVLFVICFVLAIIGSTLQTSQLKVEKSIKKQRKLRRSRNNQSNRRRNQQPNDRHYRRKKTRYRPAQFIYRLEKYHEEDIRYKEIPDPVLREIKPDESQCDLQIEIFPMYYTAVLKNLSFRAAFSSNCLSKKDLNFEVYFKGSHQVNWNYHPTSIKLNIFSNEYEIQYQDPIPRDIYDIMRSLEYTTATFLPVYPSKKIDVLNKNDTYLFPQKNDTFTAYNLAKIQNSKLIVCEAIADNDSDRSLNLNDYELKPPRQKTQIGAEDKTEEQKELEAQIARVKEVQGLKKQQFSGSHGNVEVHCKIE